MYSLVLELVRRGLETIDGFSYVDKYSAVFSETLTNKFSLTIPDPPNTPLSLIHI